MFIISMSKLYNHVHINDVHVGHAEVKRLYAVHSRAGLGLEVFHMYMVEENKLL